MRQDALVMVINTHTLIQTTSKQITYEWGSSNRVCGVTLEAFLLEEKLSSFRMQTCWEEAHLESESWRHLREIRRAALPSFLHESHASPLFSTPYEDPKA